MGLDPGSTDLHGCCHFWLYFSYLHFWLVTVGYDFLAPLLLWLLLAAHLSALHSDAPIVGERHA